MTGPEDFDTFSDVPYDLDFGSFTEALNSILYVATYVLGIIGWFVVIALTLITALDIIYLTWPVLQELARRKNWDGSQAETKFRVISKDATKAVDECMESGLRKNVVIVYLARRLKTFFICALVISILIMGPGFVINLILKWIQPIFDQFELIK